MIEREKGPEKVGYLKSITSKVKLYANGQLILDTYSCCQSLASGLRGRVFLVGSDANGSAIWLTKPYKCKTCGSLPDFTTASEFRDNWIEEIDEKIAQVTTSIDIFHSCDKGSRSIARIFAKFGEIVSVKERAIYNITYTDCQFGIGHISGGEIKDKATVAGILNEG